MQQRDIRNALNWKTFLGDFSCCRLHYRQHHDGLETKVRQLFDCMNSLFLINVGLGSRSRTRLSSRSLWYSLSRRDRSKWKTFNLGKEWVPFLVISFTFEASLLVLPLPYGIYGLAFFTKQNWPKMAKNSPEGVNRLKTVSFHFLFSSHFLRLL